MHIPVIQRSVCLTPLPNPPIKLIVNCWAWVVPWVLWSRVRYKPWAWVFMATHRVPNHQNQWKYLPSNIPTVRSEWEGDEQREQNLSVSTTSTQTKLYILEQLETKICKPWKNAVGDPTEHDHPERLLPSIGSNQTLPLNSIDWDVILVFAHFFLLKFLAVVNISNNPSRGVAWIRLFWNLAQTTPNTNGVW